jgi:microcystin degradation protein MlrC
MVTSGSLDPEGELLTAIRRLPGLEKIPIFGVLDLHCNISPAMSQHANGLVAYRENPHIDARAAAVRSAELLARALTSGVTPEEVSAVAPVLWPPTGTATADRPMRDLEAMARRLESENPGVWAVNVFGGFAFADVPCAGVGFSVSGTDTALASRLLGELVEAATALRDLGHPAEWDLDAAIREIGGNRQGPVLIVEPADNIGGGTAGDSTIVLAAFLRHGIRNAAVAIADPAAVGQLASLPLGESTTFSIGGGSGEIGSTPLTVTARLLRRSDGHFTLEDAQSHLAASQGTSFDMGPSAVVDVAGVLVLLTSRKTPPFDLGQFRSQGIAPETLTAIGVKAAVAHRRAYDPIASASYTVATLGPCASDLRRLPYRHIRAGVHPLV